MFRSHKKGHLLSRRDLLFAFYGFVSFTALASCGTNNSSTDKGNLPEVSPQSAQSGSSSPPLSVINVGHQNGTPGLNLLKARGLLEKRLKPQGI